VTARESKQLRLFDDDRRRPSRYAGAMRKLIVLGLFLLGSFACSSEGAVGEECEEEGKVDGECEDNAVCAKRSDNGALTCLKQCTEQAQCGANEDCNGVSGTNIKGCNPKAGTATK
jgi:hypothetical protein